MIQFTPDLWSAQLVEQLRSSAIYRNFNSESEAPRTPRPAYQTVSEGSYLAAVIEDELYSFVPDGEHEEAAQVMIEALNAWITERAGGRWIPDLNNPISTPVPVE